MKLVPRIRHVNNQSMTRGSDFLFVNDKGNK